MRTAPALPTEAAAVPSSPATPGAWGAGAGAGELPIVGPPWQGVQWSVLFVGFLGYIWVVTTYSLPIGDVAMGLALLGLLMQREAFRLPAFMTVFGVYVLWAALGYFHTDHQDKVLEWSITMGKIWLISLVAVNALRTPQRLRFFIFFFLGAFALYPLRGAFINFFGAGYSVAGRAVWNNIYGNPNDLAALTLLPLAMIAAFLVREPRGWPRLAALGGAVLLPLLILMTQSRGGLLAFGVAALLGLAAHRGQRVRALVTVVVLLAVVAPFAPDGVWERLGGLRNATDTSQLAAVDEEGSAEGRYGIWRVAMEMARERPLTGAGVGAYPDAHAVTASRMPDLPEGSVGPRDTHSTYLNVLAELGWPGLLLFLLVVATTLGYSERIRRRARAALPQSSRQLLYLELGVLAFLLAGVFGSYARLAFTYVFLSVVWSQARLLAEQLAAGGQPVHGAVAMGGPGGAGARRATAFNARHA